MARPDPFLNLLKDFGLLPLRLPRADVMPLNMVAQDGKDLNLLGDLTNAMVAPAGVTPPSVVQDIQTAGEIQGQRSSRVKLSIGLTILGNILKAMTGQDLGVSAAFQHASTLTFEFADVTVDKVDIILLDQYLNRVDINPNARQIHDFFLDGKMGIITATARTKKYLVTAQRDNGIDVDINVPVIQGVAGGKVNVQAASSDNRKVSFEGNTPLAFGVQGILISMDDNGHFTGFHPLKPGEGAVRGLPLAATSQPNLITVPVAFANVQATAEAQPSANT